MTWGVTPCPLGYQPLGQFLVGAPGGQGPEAGGGGGLNLSIGKCLIFSFFVPSAG